MKSPTEFDKLLSCNGRYPYIEEIVKSSNIKVSGIGILFGYVPSFINISIWRKYRKKGKVFFFKDTEIENLYELRQYAYMFVDKVGDTYITSYNVPKIGILFFEAVKGFRFELKFKAWQIYRGEVCRGKICHNFNWILRIPTYRSGKYLFLCDSEDLETMVLGKIRHPLHDLLFTYNFKVPLMYVSSIVLPLFRY
ncbi:MAG: hypothetical protein QW456_09415 [Ignisphaera sp.]